MHKIGLYIAAVITRPRNEENANVPLELRPGMIVPIPCRHCAKTLIRLTLEASPLSATCSRCGGITEVRTSKEGDALRVRTSRGPARAR
jgi:phage FluMu protein Com